MWRHKIRVKEFRTDIGLKEMLLDQQTIELNQIEDSWKINWEDLAIEKEIGKGSHGTYVVALLELVHRRRCE